MRTLVVTFLIICGVVSSAGADSKITRVPLFRVSTDVIDHFKGRLLEYEARVTSNCELDQIKPVEENWVLPNNQLKGLGFGEGTYVKMDIIKYDQPGHLVAQIKFFEKLKIYWPLTVIVAKTRSGQCQTAAFSNQPQGALQHIKLVNIGSPVELLVTSIQDGLNVVQPVKF